MYDMFLAKISQSIGTITWTKRIGSTGNDKANGLILLSGSLFVVGESDSPGWTVASTDMVFLKLDTNGNLMNFNSLGGSGAD